MQWSTGGIFCGSAREQPWGWTLIRRPRHTLALALVVSVVEIAIVVTRIVLFLAEPQWDIWHTNWFINKCFVLACFILLFGCLRRRRGEFAMWPLR